MGIQGDNADCPVKKYEFNFQLIGLNSKLKAVIAI